MAVCLLVVLQLQPIFSELKSALRATEEKYNLAMIEIERLRNLDQDSHKQGKQDWLTHRKIFSCTQNYTRQELIMFYHWKIAGVPTEQLVDLEKKYQSAVQEIVHLKKNNNEDQDYFKQRIEELTQLVDEKNGKLYCFHKPKIAFRFYFVLFWTL